MQDFRKWKRGNPSVTSLLLDSANPRIPKGRGVQQQRDLIAELEEHDKVYELAKSIVNDGYFPLEYLIAVETDGKAVVVEGNRRLAALKLLINPELAPDNRLKAFKSLSSKMPLDTIEKVPTIYAPSREAAAPLIMQKHTRLQVERWSTLMQASFYKSLAESGVTLAELAEEYGRPQSEVAGFLRIDTMYAIACSLELPEDVAKVVRDPRQFSAAVLQRLLDFPKVRDFLGIEFRDQVKLHGKVNSKEFIRAYTKIITDIANVDIDTRTVNTKEDAEKYLRSISTVKPKKTEPGKFSAEDFNIEVPDLAKGGSPKPASGKPKKKSRPQTMIPPGVRCDIDDQRIIDIFTELRKLKMKDHPNACAVLLRVLLELTVAEYLEASHQMQPIIDAAAKKHRLNPDWYPTLRQTLAGIMKDPVIKKNMKVMARKKLNMLIQTKDSVLSVDGMDGYVHNPYHHPTQRDLSGLWGALEGLFEIVLQPPPQPAKKAK
jgi:hypothetical protein